MWQFILTDLQGNSYGEVTQAASRKVQLPHLRVPSASFTIPIWHSLGPTLMDSDCLLRCYRIDPVTTQRDLAFHGQVVTAEENAEGGAQTISVTAAGPFWRMAKRIIPGSKLSSGVQYGAEGSLLDLGTVARTVLSECNGVHYTGIDLGTHEASISGWVGPWWLKNAAEGIAELAGGLNSFEHRVRPTEVTAHGNPQGWPTIGLFDVAPILGDTRPDAIFEYGTQRANVASYTRSTTRDSLLTRAILSVQGWPDSVDRDPPPEGSPEGTLGPEKYHLVQRENASAMALRGLYEEVVSDAGVLDDDLRASIGDFHVEVRKQPRQQITFKPAQNARPAPFVDYNVGDFVRARAIVAGLTRFDAQFRIWGVSFDVDQNGNENVELDLVMP